VHVHLERQLGARIPCRGSTPDLAHATAATGQPGQLGLVLQHLRQPIRVDPAVPPFASFSEFQALIETIWSPWTITP
jgi:hypothetical protein